MRPGRPIEALTVRLHRQAGALLIAAWLAAPGAHAALPPVPEPAENPVTEAKRVLGKILFWDEQLSSDSTIACGSCHRPAAGGADPRPGRNPGHDPGTIDDVAGSPGIRRLGPDGQPKPDPVFGDGPQITPRASPNYFGALWADQVFWDGRAGTTFRDPLTGEVAIAAGGALENQALTALANSAEMAREQRPWSALTTRLETAMPLALASRWPDDVAAAIRRRPTYPALFADAFGDPEITPVRIAFAIASYERTLVADQTAWDRFEAGDPDAMTQSQKYGWEAFETFRCSACHVPPQFTNNDFLNIGLRWSYLDRGREDVTGDPEDAGEFKVPTLRNAALKPRLSHTGEFPSLAHAVAFYRTGAALPDRDDIPGHGIYAFNMSPLTQADLVEFIRGALVDPRVANETFPFDRPLLGSENGAQAPQSGAPGGPAETLP